MEKKIERLGGTRFYDYEDGRVSNPMPFFSWESEIQTPLIIQQSTSRFEPCSANRRLFDLFEGRPDLDRLKGEPKVTMDSMGCRRKVFYELIELEANPISFLEKFPFEMEKAAKLPEDATLWFDTGFWAAKSGATYYTGIGLRSASEVLKRIEHGSFSFVLTYSSAVISYNCELGPEAQRLVLEVYFGNQFAPFAEERRTLHHSLESIAEWDTIQSSVLDYEIMQQASPNQLSTDNHIGRREEWARSFALKPIKVVKAETRHGRRHYSLAVFPRPFGLLPWKCLNTLPFVLAHNADGHWIDEDFEAAKKYQLFGLSPLFLTTCTIIECAFVEIRRFSF